MRAVLIAGGNLGDVREALERAAAAVERRVGSIGRRSAVYESEPWGFEAPERFLNQVWVVETALEPEALLDELQAIERESGRTEKSTGGAYRSRTMDIDILFYDQRVIDTPRLQVPHPLLHRRGFVLEPLREVMPEAVHPVLGKKIGEL